MVSVFQKPVIWKTGGGTEVQDILEGSGKVAKPGRKVRGSFICIAYDWFLGRCLSSTQGD
jgi:hypothetical protein